MTSPQLHHIKPFETVGFKIPRALGNGFISGFHGDIFNLEPILDIWCVTPKESYDYKKEEIDPRFDVNLDFAINYLNFARVGSNVNERFVGIETADPTPTQLRADSDKRKRLEDDLGISLYERGEMS